MVRSRHFSERPRDGGARLIGAKQDFCIRAFHFEVAPLLGQNVRQREPAKVVRFEHNVHVLPCELTNVCRIDLDRPARLAFPRDCCVDFGSGRPLPCGKEQLGAIPRPQDAPRLAEGTRVRHVRSSFLPADELYLHVLEAESAEAAGEAMKRAGIDPERIAETVPVG